jgi:polar amino acid transport system permease protein
LYDLRWEYVTNNLDLFFDGLWLSLYLSFVALGIGSLIGVVLAFLRATGNRAARYLITAYVEAIRNIPLLLIVFFLYYGAPRVFPRGSTGQEWVLKLLPDGEKTFMVALSIYAAAYLTEIFSAGILSVSRRYLDAGRSLGLSRFQMALHVTRPIMFRTVLPSLSNTLISLFKDTSIAFWIGVEELSYAANRISTDYFRVIEAWTAAGVLYLITSYALAVILRAAERRYRWTV